MYLKIFYNATVFILAPVENINKPLTNCEKTKYRRISIVLSIIWTTIAVITYFSFNEICQSITVTALIIAVMMIVGKNINSKEVRKYEKDNINNSSFYASVCFANRKCYCC